MTLVTSQVSGSGLGRQTPAYHGSASGGDPRDTRNSRGVSSHSQETVQQPHQSSVTSQRPISSRHVRTNSSTALAPQETNVTAHAEPPSVSRRSSSIETPGQLHRTQSSTGSARPAFDQSGFPLTSNPPLYDQDATASSRPESRVPTAPSSPSLGPTHRSTLSLAPSEASSPSQLRVRVRDLAHIQSFASQDNFARPRLSSGRHYEANRQYEISAMPVTDIIEMVAGLLTRITGTNDRQHEYVNSDHNSGNEDGNERPRTSDSERRNPLSSHGSCVLAFHGKNIPSITILSYLTRIHKYCPTTYEVFLSLLVYFDRMTDNFNKRFLAQASPDQRLQQDLNTNTIRTRGHGMERADSTDSNASEATITDQEFTRERPAHPENVRPQNHRTSSENASMEELQQFFVVDSYNIHRLVIAGVTCASKFFSDVFYTNSRYAKVGGLPLPELNNLELQFLLLNDFRLSVPVEELEAYGTKLVEFYAREVVAQQQGGDHTMRSPDMSARDKDDDMYMQQQQQRSG